MRWTMLFFKNGEKIKEVWLGWKKPPVGVISHHLEWVFWGPPYCSHFGQIFGHSQGEPSWINPGNIKPRKLPPWWMLVQMFFFVQVKNLFWITHKERVGWYNIHAHIGTCIRYIIYFHIYIYIFEHIYVLDWRTYSMISLFQDFFQTALSSQKDAGPKLPLKRTHRAWGRRSQSTWVKCGFHSAAHQWRTNCRTCTPNSNTSCQAPWQWWQIFFGHV